MSLLGVGGGRRGCGAGRQELLFSSGAAGMATRPSQGAQPRARAIGSSPHSTGSRPRQPSRGSPQTTVPPPAPPLPTANRQPPSPRGLHLLFRHLLPPQPLRHRQVRAQGAGRRRAKGPRPQRPHRQRRAGQAGRGLNLNAPKEFFGIGGGPEVVAAGRLAASPAAASLGAARAARARAAPAQGARRRPGALPAQGTRPRPRRARAPALKTPLPSSSLPPRRVPARREDGVWRVDAVAHPLLWNQGGARDAFKSRG
jgi:hypothetical protein